MPLNATHSRSCFVPMCKSTDKSTPGKIFVSVPSKRALRRAWWVAARRAFPVSKSHKIYCCQDHFDLKEDMKNYLYYSMMGGPIKLKPGVRPHKFDCQELVTPQSENRDRLQNKRKVLVILSSEDNMMEADQSKWEPDSPEREPRVEKRRNSINQDTEWLEDRIKAAKEEEDISEDSLSLDIFPLAFFRVPLQVERETSLERCRKPAEMREEMGEAQRLLDLSLFTDSVKVKSEMGAEGDSCNTESGPFKPEDTFVFQGEGASEEQNISPQEFKLKQEDLDDSFEIKVEEEELEMEFEGFAVESEESPVQPPPRPEETREENNTVKSGVETEEQMIAKVKEEELSDELECEIIKKSDSSPVQLSRQHRKETKRKEKKNKASKHRTAPRVHPVIHTIVPMDVDDSDADFEATDDDLEDPEFYCSSSDECDSEEGSPAGAKRLRAPRLRGGLRLEDEEDPDSEGDAPAPEAPLEWKREDIAGHPPPDYDFMQPARILAPHEYFMSMMTSELMDHIACHTNLYAMQCDSDTDFATDRNEILNLIGILLHAGAVRRPPLEDCRKSMAPGRFLLLRGLLHFNDNGLCHLSYDRFYKVRPIFDFISRSFRNMANTPRQSVGRIMVPYGDARAQGFKLFCRASEDGAIHDLILYQSQITFDVHPVALSARERAMSFGSRVVVALARTIHDTSISSLYAGSPLASLELAGYLKEEFGCRFTGVVEEGQLAGVGLPDVGALASRRKGFFDFRASGGTLALWWKDWSLVTLLSNEVGIKPLSTFRRRRGEARKAGAALCPRVVRSHLRQEGVLARTARLVDLYATPTWGNRWYLRLFGLALDLSMVNAWLLYRRDCSSLGVPHVKLREFRLKVAAFAMSDGPTLDAALGPSQTSVSRPDELLGIYSLVPEHGPDS